MAYDAHERPPQRLKEVFKKYQKISFHELDQDEEVLDLEKLRFEDPNARVHAFKWMEHPELSQVFDKFMASRANCGDTVMSSGEKAESILAFRPASMPDLIIVPAMLPHCIQSEVLDRVFQRDLLNPAHKTNVHLHHDLSYPDQDRSFFSLDPASKGFILPKDPSMHKPLDIGQFMNKKLRWVTLGGQYDWTRKVYPDEQPPDFPADLAEFLHGLFPDTTPEAAIVNLYSPGDTLSLHRDVSEDCGKGLISISIGCDGLFVIGLDGESSHLTWLVIRLRSGDALYMSGSSRFAWHGVPKIISNTCPSQLRDWPDDSEGQGLSSAWRGWMASKRINLNVRQMED